MIKGTRIQMTNSVPVLAYSGALMTAVGLYTVPTGRTFVLTDLVVSFIPTAAAGTVGAGIALLDSAYGQGASAFVAEEIKVAYKLKTTPFHGTITSATASSYLSTPLVVTGLENGPEFSTCVTAGNIGTYHIQTGGIYIGGILR